MPKMSVYLPDDLYEVVKENDWSISELLQEAVRVKMEHDERLRAGEEYLAWLTARTGEPTEEDVRAAEESIQRLDAHFRSRRDLRVERARDAA